MKRGRFIVVEGLEGAGKSTAIATLKTLLQQHDIQVLLTREPGGTPLGETVRTVIKHEEPMDPRAELLLFYAARVQLLESVIKPALAVGTWVLADRFELSTFAYQGGGRGMSSEMISHLSKFCVGTMQPDLLFYLDITPEQGLERAIGRGKLDRIEQESISFFESVHAAYHQYLQAMSAVVYVDASRDLPQVQDALIVAMNHYLRSEHVEV
ncbi:MAG: dTMP kinase [Gammaproteobacteria bacterium]|nr:dTMP kinase [Gammaproteobacteria bacterium]